MQKAKNIIKYIATAFLVLLVSLCIYTFIVTDIMKKDYVNVFGYTYFVVATGSMSGTIEVDDIIFVRITKNVKENDIITFKNKDGDIITHRLIRKDGSHYITKGDVNNVADESISKGQIIGKVKWIVSPSFILKSIAIFLIVFILLALVNFDNIVKKYIIRDNSKKEKDDSSSTEEEKENTKNTETSVATKISGSSTTVPDEIFHNPKKHYDEPSSGMTVTIAFDAMEALERAHAKEVERDERVEVLEDYDEFVFSYEPMKKKNKDSKEKETIDFLVSILKCKSNNTAKSRMNKKWLEKYRYVYKLCYLLLENDTERFREEVENPPFREIYDYDLDRVGLTQSIRNRLYDMPVYVFLRILTYAILYNDDELFDGVYKILKYKTAIDPTGDFIQLSRYDQDASKQVRTLVAFMKKVPNKFDNKHVFELDKVERMVKIGKY